VVDVVHGGGLRAYAELADGAFERLAANPKAGLQDMFGEKGYLRIPYSLFDRHVWNDDIWAVGALEKMGQRTLIDGTVREVVEDAQRNGAAQTQSALKALGKEIGDDLKKRTDDAKLSIRERLLAQEKQLEEKRKKDEGGGNNGR